jgi:hypothetical protein
MAIKNYYKILSISEKATTKEIISAFRKLAKKYHPDLNKSHDTGRMFREIYEAYELLTDDSKRKQHDIFLMYERQNQNFSKARENDNYGGPSDVYKQSYNKYSEWTESAKKNAEEYSNLSYKDFIKVVLKGITKFSVAFLRILYEFLIELAKEVIPTILVLAEKYAVILLVIIIPVLSFEINIYIGYVSVSLSIIFALIYYLFQKKQGSLLFYLLKKSNKRKLHLSIFLFYISYCIFVVLFYYTDLMNIKKKTISEQETVTPTTTTPKRQKQADGTVTLDNYSLIQLQTRIKEVLNSIKYGNPESDMAVSKKIKDISDIYYNTYTIAGINVKMRECVTQAKNDVRIWRAELKKAREADSSK